LLSQIDEYVRTCSGAFDVVNTTATALSFDGTGDDDGETDALDVGVTLLGLGFIIQITTFGILG